MSEEGKGTMKSTNPVTKAIRGAIEGAADFLEPMRRGIKQFAGGAQDLRRALDAAHGDCQYLLGSRPPLDEQLKQLDDDVDAWRNRVLAASDFGQRLVGCLARAISVSAEGEVTTTRYADVSTAVGALDPIGALLLLCPNELKRGLAEIITQTPPSDVGPAWPERVRLLTENHRTLARLEEQQRQLEAEALEAARELKDLRR